MKTILIYYFSTTGNTRHLAERAKSILEKTTADRKGDDWSDCKIKIDLVDIIPLCKHLSAIDAGKEELDISRFPQADGYIFASMTYAFRFPKIVERVMMTIPDAHIEGKPFFAVDCNAGQGAFVVRNIYNIMTKKGGLSAGTINVKGPSNWFPGTGCTPDGVWKQKELVTYDNRITSIPVVFSKVVAEKKGINDSKLRALLAPVKLLSDSLLSKTMSSFQWDEDKCIHCNVCVNRCPTNSLEFVTIENETGKNSPKLVINNSTCVGCLSCVNNCPKRAIDCKASLKYERLYKFTEKALPEGQKLD